MEDEFKKFLELTEAMRTAQKEYFRSRSGASLNKSKGLERQVDAEIINNRLPNLFK